MIFPSEIEQRLGFDQIRLKLSNYCQGPLGVQQVELMRFSSLYSNVFMLLRQNLEFKLILETGREFPTTAHSNPDEHFKRAAIEGSYLEEEAFQQIIRSLQIISECKIFLKQNLESYPELFKLTLTIFDPITLIKSLQSKFDDHGLIRDAASAELAKIRKSLHAEQSRVKRLMDQLFRHAADQGWVPEGVSAAVRDGRLVIPVLAEHKRKIKGFVVDESATGQTVYLEPAEVLEANNEIRDLFHAERREVIKILKELTSLLRIHLPDVYPAFQFLGVIDFTRAKAKFALDIQAEMPHLKDHPDLNWLQARHPLLFLSLKGKREIVPLTIELTQENPFLLISGPNAGGKSVCLKTVGLIQYMVQCGVLPPMHDKSSVGIFKNIFLDIGDQQSIENDLSTYSSHLKNMNFFIHQSDGKTLVLMDELGSGTDPNFGGGISESILSDLTAKKVWGLATTHYYNLKLFASNHVGIRNGAMQFDTKKLEPLFKLEIGKPGSSFALEIARKTGLPAATLQRAEKIIGTELTGLETLMKSVAEEKQLLERRKREIEQREAKLKETLSHYQKLSSELEGKKKEIINKAKEEASSLLKETNREIEKTIRHIRENKAEKKETRKVRQGLQSLVSKVETPVKEAERKHEKIAAGDKVRLIGQEVTGTVLTIKDDSALVKFGDLRSNVKLKKLIRSDLAEVNPTLTKARSLGLDVMRKQSTFVSTLDIRGKRVEEVISVLDQFIDDALLLGQSELKILHGKGEGVLRKVVRDHLKKVKQVVSVADEHVERGGDGITVVILK
jgi:DNA mismatch repair protein MutS2